MPYREVRILFKWLWILKLFPDICVTGTFGISQCRSVIRDHISPFVVRTPPPPKKSTHLLAVCQHIWHKCSYLLESSCILLFFKLCCDAYCSRSLNMKGKIITWFFMITYSMSHLWGKVLQKDFCLENPFSLHFRKWIVEGDKVQLFLNLPYSPLSKYNVPLLILWILLTYFELLSVVINVLQPYWLTVS